MLFVISIKTQQIRRYAAT